MTPSALFIETIDELRWIQNNPSDYRLLRGNALLRQLLIDGTTLIDVVNRNHRIKLGFEVSNFWATELGQFIKTSGKVSGYCAADGLYPKHPKNAFRQYPIARLTRREFLNFPVIITTKHHATIADVIKICANVLGGVHVGRPHTDKESALASDAIQVGGQRLPVFQTRSIIAVAVDGIQPLYEAVRRS